MAKAEMYYIIHCSEDGDIAVEEFPEEELQEALEDYEYTTSFKTMPVEDIMYWKKMLIIKGNIVVPRFKEKRHG